MTDFDYEELEELINILYNNKEIRKFFICEDIDDNNQDKKLLRTIQVKMNIIPIFRI